MFQRILVPLDGSQRAEQALPVAARIARATGGSLLLAQVVNLPFDFTTPWSPVPLVYEQILESERNTATAYLKSLAASPRLSGIETSMEVALGFPAQHLCTMVENRRIDLLVLCSHGRTGFTRWVLGSVARALVHQCTVPLLVLRQREEPSALSSLATAASLRTLIPLDGSLLAEAALGPAVHLTAALTEPGQGALHLAQVVKIFPTTAAEGFLSELNAETLERAGTYLSRVEEQMRTEVQEFHLSLTHSVELASETTLALAHLAEHGKEGNGECFSPCDLIAMATHGRGGLGRWVMGSITEHLLDTTNLPMLLVRPPKAG